MSNLQNTQSIDPKLLKIVALAKQGDRRGEKDTADRLVRRICERLGLNYVEVMQEGETYRAFTLSISYKNDAELQVLSQVCFKFGDTGHPDCVVQFSRARKKVFVTTTSARFVEVEQAAAVYLAAYRKQRRQLLNDLTSVFIQKNRLFSDFPDHEDEDGPDQPQRTAESRAEQWRRAHLYESLERTEFRKAISGPKS